MEKPEQKTKSQAQTKSPTLDELIAIRQELENLQNQGLDTIWKEIKNFNQQNAELLNELKLLRKTLADQIVNGFIRGTILMGILSGLLLFVLYFISTT